jgi:hypothetical protein
MFATLALHALIIYLAFSSPENITWFREHNGVVYPVISQSSYML